MLFLHCVYFRRYWILNDVFYPGWGPNAIDKKLIAFDSTKMRRLSADLVRISTWSADVPSELEARDIAGFGRLVVSVIFVLNSPFDQPGKSWQICMITIFQLNKIIN